MSFFSGGAASGLEWFDGMNKRGVRDVADEDDKDVDANRETTLEVRETESSIDIVSHSKSARSVASTEDEEFDMCACYRQYWCCSGPRSKYCCTFAKAGDDVSVVYSSFQSTLQTYLTVTTLLMGFIVTGALISVSWAPDATFTQSELQTFVRVSLTAFGYALLAFAISLIFSLVAQQIFATQQLASCAVKMFKLLAPFMLLAEFFMYSCGIQVCDFLAQYLKIMYVTPTAALCTGEDFLARGDSFCAQLGNDMFDAALGLDACRHSWVLNKTVEGQVQSARIFNLSMEPDPKKLGQNKEISVCNQLDWYVYQHAVDPTTNSGFAQGQKVKLWFGYMAYPDLKDKQSWGQKAYVQHPHMPVSQTGELAKGLDLTIIENNGKVLGEAMCGKGPAQDYMDKVCNDTKPAAFEKNDDGTPKTKTYIEAECDTAKHTYNEADDCAGQKFDDVMKCYRTCEWNTKDMSARKEYDGVIKNINRCAEALRFFILIRVLTFLPWWLYTVLIMVFQFGEGSRQAIKHYDDWEGYLQNLRGDPPVPKTMDRGQVNELTVEELVVKNRIERVAPPAEVPLLSSALITTSRTQAPQQSMAKVGVDLNNDGRPDIYYVGADLNHDGVPDLLQGGAGLFSSSASYSRTSPSSAIAPTSLSRPSTSGAVV